MTSLGFLLAEFIPDLELKKPANPEMPMGTNASPKKTPFPDRHAGKGGSLAMHKMTALHQQNPAQATPAMKG